MGFDVPILTPFLYHKSIRSVHKNPKQNKEAAAKKETRIQSLQLESAKGKILECLLSVW